MYAFCFLPLLIIRLQPSNLPEPKSLGPSKKTTALQEYNLASAKVNEVIFHVISGFKSRSEL